MNLYELNCTMNDIKNRLEQYAYNNDGEVSPEFLDELSKVELARENKIDNICYMIKEFEADYRSIKEEVKELNRRAEVCENNSEALKKYLASILSGEKFKSPTNVVSYRKSESVVIDDENLLPEECFVVEMKPSKTAVKALIEHMKSSGKNCGGAHIETKNNIQIK